MQDNKKMSNEDGAILMVGLYGKKSGVGTLLSNPQTVDQNYNRLLLAGVEGLTPLHRYTIRSGDVTFYRYNVPLSDPVFKNSSPMAIANYTRNTVPDDKKDLYETMVQYDRGNRDLTGRNIENRVMVTAAETDKGVLLFGDEVNERAELRNYVKYLGDNFFHPELSELKTLNLHTVMTDHPDLIKLAQEPWEYPPFVPNEHHPDKVKFNRVDFSQCHQESPSILFDVGFKPIETYDLKPDFENCRKLHSDFILDLSDENKKICALSEVAECGFDCSNEAMTFLVEQNKEGREVIKECMKGGELKFQCGKDDDEVVDYMNGKLSKWARQTLEKEFPDMRKAKPELQPSKGIKQG